MGKIKMGTATIAAEENQVGYTQSERMMYLTQEISDYVRSVYKSDALQVIKQVQDMANAEEKTNELVLNSKLESFDEYLISDYPVTGQRRLLDLLYAVHRIDLDEKNLQPGIFETCDNAFFDVLKENPQSQVINIPKDRAGRISMLENYLDSLIYKMWPLRHSEISRYINRCALNKSNPSFEFEDIRFLDRFINYRNYPEIQIGILRLYREFVYYKLGAEMDDNTFIALIRQCFGLMAGAVQYAAAV